MMINPWESQYHNDEITTFEAYRRMGMSKDYRNYRNIPDVCHILGTVICHFFSPLQIPLCPIGIKPKFVLLTNNPDKIEALRSQGMDVVGVEAIEVPVRNILCLYSGPISTPI